MRWLLPAGLGAALLIGSCQRAEPQERSLAGAGVIPGIEDLQGEDIAIALVKYPKHERFSETLLIELRRGNSIRISHMRDTFLPGHQDPRQDTLSVVERRLSGTVGDQARKHIALLRPSNPDGKWGDAIPKGCRWIADGAIDLQLAFFRNQDSGAFFNVQDGCDSPDLPKIHKVVRDTLKALQVSPQSYGFVV